MRNNLKSLDTSFRTLLNHQSSRALVVKWGNLKSRNIQKAVYNIRLTILCGLITILVLRGTIGTGFFTFSSGPATDSSQDLERRVLGSDADKQHEKDLDKDPPIDKSVPFSLGHPIKNWDEQRAEWLSTHKNVTKNKFGRDRILLISGSASKPCLNPVGDHLLVKSLKNKMDYCRSATVSLFLPSFDLFISLHLLAPEV